MQHSNEKLESEAQSFGGSYDDELDNENAYSEEVEGRQGYEDDDTCYPNDGYNEYFCEDEYGFDEFWLSFQLLYFFFYILKWFSVFFDRVALCNKPKAILSPAPTIVEMYRDLQSEEKFNSALFVTLYIELK